MKQPIIAAMRTLTSAYILSMLLWHASSASEHTTADDQPTTLTYNAEATAKLQEVFDNTNDLNYKENSAVLRRLVEQDHADPNINKHGFSLLYNATQKNDTPLVASLLDHRADPNPPEDNKPIFTAKSTEVAQLLVNAKADIHALNRSRENALHTAATYGAPAEVITFWCNAGVDLRQKCRLSLTPLRTLCLLSRATPASMVPFLWSDANFTTEDQEEVIEELTKRSPEMVPTLKALITVVPQVKAEKTARYEQTKKLLTQHLNKDIMPLVMGYTRQLPDHLTEKTARYEQTKKLLTQHLNKDVMPLVMGYTRQLPGPLYDVRYFKQDIEPRMLALLAAEEATNRSSKRIKVSPQVQ